MRISDWSSDVCSSDLHVVKLRRAGIAVVFKLRLEAAGGAEAEDRRRQYGDHHRTVDRAELLVKLGGDLRTAQAGALIEILQREEHDRGVGRARAAVRSEERRVGKVCCRTCRSGCAPYH